MDAGQRRFFKYLGELVEQEFDVPVIVNIGVLLGCSMVCFRAGAPSARLFGVDNDYERRSPGMEVKEYLRATFIEGDSTASETQAQVQSPVHLLLLDGGHSYGTVKRDVQGWVVKIVPGGIVSFHDCHLGGVSKAVIEWRRSEGAAWTEIEGPCPGIRTFQRPSSNDD